MSFPLYTSLCLASTLVYNGYMYTGKFMRHKEGPVFQLYGNFHIESIDREGRSIHRLAVTHCLIRCMLKEKINVYNKV